MHSAIRSLTVEFGDCDPAGIVFYPNFYRWFDAATHHLFAKVNMGLDSLLKDYGVVGMPLVETGAKYFSPARFGDRLAIESNVVSCERKVIRIRHIVRREDVLLVEGFELRVLVVPHPDDPTRECALELYEEMRSVLS